MYSVRERKGNEKHSQVRLGRNSRSGSVHEETSEGRKAGRGNRLLPVLRYALPNRNPFLRQVSCRKVEVLSLLFFVFVFSLPLCPIYYYSSAFLLLLLFVKLLCTWRSWPAESERVINLSLGNSIFPDLLGCAAGSPSSLPACVFIIIAFVFPERRLSEDCANQHFILFVHSQDII